MTPVRLVNKGENKGMTQARRKEGVFRAPITRIFVQQNRSGEAPNTFRSSTGKGVSVVSPKCLCSSAPDMRVVAGRIRHAYTGAETIGEKAARSKRGLHQVFELVSSVHRLVRLVKPWRQERDVRRGALRCWRRRRSIGQVRLPGCRGGNVLSSRLTVRMQSWSC